MRPAPLDLLPEPGALIGDRVIHEGSGGEYEHVYAANGRPTKRVPLSGSHEVELATKAARDALPVWQGMSSNDRRRLLLRAAELVRDGADLLGTLTTVDSATPKAGNDVAASWGAEFLEYNAAWIDRIGGEIRPADQGRPMHAYTRDEPYGVVAAMTPFNAPIIAASMVLGPVLAAGNTIVLKPSHLAPYGILRLGQLFLEAGFPPGVVNIVPGSGSVTGDASFARRRSTRCSSQGSATASDHFLVAAAESGPKPVALELGGKSPAIVYDDADLAAAVQSTIGSGFTMGGQGCVLGTRLLVQASIYDEFVDQAGALASSIVVGDPFEETTAMGPVFNAKACERILDVISEAVDSAQGKIVAGGERVGGNLPTATSSHRRYSPMSTPRRKSPVKRSLGRCSASCASMTRQKRSRSPTTRRMDSAPTYTPTMWGGCTAWPRVSRAEWSTSMARLPEGLRRGCPSGASNTAVSAGSAASRRSVSSPGPRA